jgi:hypothetical protein
MTARNQQNKVKEQSSVVDLNNVLKCVLPFVSAHGYDLLNLRLTSRGILNAMEDPSAPEIPQVLVLRQERVPTKMEMYMDQEGDLIVAQLQLFRLLLFHKEEGEGIEKQTRGWIRQVTVSLRNIVGPSLELSQMEARSTCPNYRICTKPKKQHPHGCGWLHFSTNSDFAEPGGCWNPDGTGFSRRGFRVDMLHDDPAASAAERERFFFSSSEASASAHRHAMSCSYECAKRIARLPDHETPYPSEIFLMKRLPVALYPYFPKEFDFKAPVADRKTTVELTYHPFHYFRDQTWGRFIPVEENELRVYDLNELPVY